MHPNYFREQKHYSLNDIQKRLSCDNDKCRKVLGVLKRYGIVKSVDSSKPEYSDLSDLDVIISDVTENAEVAYKFCFVGVVLVDEFVFCCYPKYIDTKTVEEKDFKQILEVIRKYDSKEQIVHLYNGTDENKSFNRLAVSLWLLRDYWENGIYTNQKTIIETNGEGEILWDNTINETFAIIKNNKPYYVELQTLNTLSNELDYFKLLHECILTVCSKELEKAGLLDLFDIPKTELTNTELDDFGDKDYIKYRLENEIRNQFVTKKQTLLKTLYTYISERDSEETGNSLNLYGTTSFNLVWEKACGEIFDNIRDARFSELKKRGLIPEGKIKNPNFDKWLDDGKNEYLNDSKPFKSLMEQITWTFKGDVARAPETLEPDIITITKNAFFILDAKYYIINVENKAIYQQPGIQDVVKQFAYQRAFADFIKEHYQTVKNAFILPMKKSEEKNEDFRIVGKAELKLMQYFSEKKILSPIELIEMRPEYVYECFIYGKKCTDKLNGLTELVDESELLEVADLRKQTCPNT